MAAQLVSRKRATRKTRPQMMQRSPTEPFPQLIQPGLQRGRFFLVGLDHLGDIAHLGVHAGGDGDTATAAIGHHGAHKGHVLAVPSTASGAAIRLAFFWMGKDSPVSEASSILRLMLSSRRKSVGT